MRKTVIVTAVLFAMIFTLQPITDINTVSAAAETNAVTLPAPIERVLPDPDLAYAVADEMEKEVTDTVTEAELLEVLS